MKITILLPDEAKYLNLVYATLTPTGICYLDNHTIKGSRLHDGAEFNYSEISIKDDTDAVLN